MAEHLYTNDKLVAEVVNNVAVLVTDTMVVDPICSVDIGARTAAFTGTPAAFNVGVLEALMSAITNIEGAGAITNILEWAIKDFSAAATIVSTIATYESD